MCGIKEQRVSVTLYLKKSDMERLKKFLFQLDQSVSSYLRGIVLQHIEREENQIVDTGGDENGDV